MKLAALAAVVLVVGWVIGKPRAEHVRFVTFQPCGYELTPDIADTRFIEAPNITRLDVRPEAILGMYQVTVPTGQVVCTFLWAEGDSRPVLGSIDEVRAILERH